MKIKVKEYIVGKSDIQLYPFYKNNIELKGKVALLGFSNHSMFKFGDLYDKQLGNWDINSKWNLKHRYDTIICLRCTYFAKNPEEFIDRCKKHLTKKGKLYFDFGLGDHWRFDNYKIGWVKDGEHEYAYDKTNFLYSTIWDPEFRHNKQFQIFEKNIRKYYKEDYDIADIILDEVPFVMKLSYVQQKLKLLYYKILTLWEDYPQLYILVVAENKD